MRNEEAHSSSRSPEFDLEIAIETWRQFLKANRNFRKEDIKELECHLRDRAEEYAEEGMTQEAAYRKALNQLGTFPELESEYRKVRFGANKRVGSVSSELSWNLNMLKNYLVVAVRNIKKKPLYSFISIGGLSVGIACSLLLGSVVVSELTFDQFHQDSSDIYRVLGQRGENRVFYHMGAPVSSVLLESVPEIEQSLRFWEGSAYISRGESQFRQNVLMADPSYFELFSFELVRGSVSNALDSGSFVVISSAIARKLFGAEDPLGQNITLRIRGNAEEYQVTGILEDVPFNSSIRADVILPFSNMTKFLYDGYLSDSNGENNQFVKLRSDANPAEVDAKLQDAVTLLAGPDSGIQLFLQPFSEYRLGEFRGRNGLGARRAPQELYTLGLISLAILLIACFNFTILTLGRSFSRFREVGMRKVIGAQRGQLVAQFMNESWLVTLFAMGLGLLIAVSLTGPFNDLLNTSISVDLLQSRYTILVAVALPLLIGLLAGGYPSLLLSRLQATSILSGKFKFGGKSLVSRFLLLSQLSLSVGFIIMALFVGKQLQYVSNKDLGFDKEELLTLPIADRSIAETLVAHMKRNAVGRAGLRGATVSSYSFSGGGGSSTSAATADTTLEVYYYRVDLDFLTTMGMELKAGRNFSESMPGDLNGSVLVNETYARKFGLESVIGSTVNHTSGVLPAEPTIVGVVEDFNNLSLLYDTVPTLFHLSPNQGLGTMFIRIAPTGLQESITLIEKAWKEAYPGGPFSYRFLDEVIADRYESQRKWARIYLLAAILGVLISCLGLFGLSSLVISNRMKEVGIRKVMGASSSSIVYGLSKEFLLLCLVAFVIAVPLTILPVQGFLNGFAYRIPLQIGLFFYSGLIALAAVLIAVGSQALKAAQSRPVVSLRTE